MKRVTTTSLQRIIDALRRPDPTGFGPTFDVTDGSPPRKFLEAFGALPLGEVENTFDDIVRETRWHTSSRPWDISFSFARKTAVRAEGKVGISFKTVQTTPDPYFSAATLVFIDGQRRRYDLIADVALPAKQFDSNASGTSSNAIDASRTKIAQRIVIGGTVDVFVQAFGAKVTGSSGTPTYTVTLQTDSSGSPSGTNVHANLSKTGFIPTSGVFTTGVWEEGAWVEPGTYWLVFERTAGTATFDGGLTGTADQVKSFSGSWGLDIVENLNAELILGGVAEIRAQSLGSAGNVGANSIADVQFANSTVSARWTTNVDSATNQNPLTGGRDDETPGQYRTRVRRRLASTGGAGPDGLLAAVEDGVDGVESLDYLENTSLTPGSEDPIFASAATGTASETIDATTTKLAQKFTVAERRWANYFNGKLASDASLICTVGIHADAAGSPGALEDAALEKTGFDFDGTALTSGDFGGGAYLDPGDYWLVFTRTSGSGTFDGDTSGAAGDVKNFDGAWANDANIDKLNADVTGGLPAKSYRIYADGGDVDDIAQALEDHRPVGITLDGADSGTAQSPNRGDVTVYFERPTIVPIYFDITVRHTDDFAGDADTIRDAIVAIVGGTDTEGVVHAGLGVAEDVLKDAITTTIKSIPGVVDTSIYKADTVDPPVATTNISIEHGKKAKVSAVATDIDVTLSLVSTP